jgi:two-component system, LytTR family, sensor kinase
MPIDATKLRTSGEASARSGQRILPAFLSFLRILCIFTLIGVLFALEYYLFYVRGGTPKRPLSFFLVGTISMAYSWALVAPIILWACKRWEYERGRRWRVLSYHLLLLVAVAPVRALLDMGLAAIILTLHHEPQLEMMFSDNRANFLSGLPTAPVYYFVIAGLGYTSAYYRKFREQELAASNLERALAQAHLETLVNQLNPHFLFNTLNAIGTLVRTDPEATKRMVTLLGGLLRRSLGSSTEPQEVPLRRELEFVKQYLEIEQVLFSDRLQVEYEVPQELLDVPVPNFLLQPIVENAIQHGIALRSGPGRIILRARVAEGSLEVSVADDGVGLADGSRQTEGRGLGLTRERLTGLYGEEASLRIENREGGGAVAVLKLPLSTGQRGSRGEGEP